MAVSTAATLCVRLFLVPCEGRRSSASHRRVREQVGCDEALGPGEAMGRKLTTIVRDMRWKIEQEKFEGRKASWGVKGELGA